MTEHHQRKEDQGLHKALRMWPIIVAFATIVAGWTATQADSSLNKKGIKDNKEAIVETQKKLDTVKEAVIRMEERQKQVQHAQGTMGSDIKDILRALSRGIGNNGSEN